VAIAHVREAQLREAIQAVNSLEVEAIMQVGTNLAMARLAPQAERWLGKPVIAINTAIYRHALGASGINDKISRWGPLLEVH
jgi:maleate isomerase